jgi:hypothetical protein
MRRLFRILLNAATVLSLLLCAATVPRKRRNTEDGAHGEHGEGYGRRRPRRAGFRAVDTRATAGGKPLRDA